MGLAQGERRRVWIFVLSGGNLSAVQVISDRLGAQVKAPTEQQNTLEAAVEAVTDNNRQAVVNSAVAAVDERPFPLTAKPVSRGPDGPNVLVWTPFETYTR